MGFIKVCENLESYSAFSSGISEKLLDAAVDNADLSSSITLGFTAAEVRDVFGAEPTLLCRTVSRGCLVRRAPGIRWHQASSLFSSSWLKRDFLSDTAVRTNHGKVLGRENKWKHLLATTVQSSLLIM